MRFLNKILLTYIIQLQLVYVRTRNPQLSRIINKLSLLYPSIILVRIVKQLIVTLHPGVEYLNLVQPAYCDVFAVGAGGDTV